MKVGIINFSEVGETSPKWYDLAEKNIEQGDSIQKSYEGKLNGKTGYLILSNRKLLFVREEGFLRKTYDLSLDLPYEKIDKISHEGRYELELTDVEGKKHDFKTFAVPVSRIAESLEDLVHV